MFLVSSKTVRADFSEYSGGLSCAYTPLAGFLPCFPSNCTVRLRYGRQLVMRFLRGGRRESFHGRQIAPGTARCLLGRRDMAWRAAEVHPAVRPHVHGAAGVAERAASRVDERPVRAARCERRSLDVTPPPG